MSKKAKLPVNCLGPAIYVGDRKFGKIFRTAARLIRQENSTYKWKDSLLTAGRKDSACKNTRVRSEILGLA